MSLFVLYYPVVLLQEVPLTGGGGATKEDEVNGGPRTDGGGPPGTQFSCIHCAAPFPTRDQLEKHELLHSPNAQVSCKVCNKTFANVYRLQRHMISHDESAILRKFKCPECEKAFKFKHHLKEHIRIHSGEKPFECPNCGKRFSHSGSYSSHMTSKKCLVMNLKVSQRQASPRAALEMKHNTSYRGQPIKQHRSNNNNNFPNIPKYNDTAFLSSFPPPVTGAMPFYLNPNFVPPTSPYNMHNPLSHLLEQLQPQNRETKKEVEEEKRDHQMMVIKQEAEEEEVVKRPESSPGAGSNSGDLEAVKRILETVNATVTKQLLAANIQKLSSNSCSSGCPSVASGAPSPPVDDGDTFNCRTCNKAFISRVDLHQHERYVCSDEKSEGLAAKLEDVISVKQEDTNGNICSTSEDETRGSNNIYTDEEVDIDQDGRKVRVRSQIADEQLQILKSYYSLNPRPKREELARIAERVGFPVRVVQVWFQNNRARDRREGRLVQVPYVPPVFPTMFSGSSPIVPGSEQPLDLSTKKLHTYSPASSPPRSPLRSDSEDGGSGGAVNLSRRPTFDSRLARILTQPNGTNYYAPEHMAPTSPLPAIAAVHTGSISPYDKRSWKQDDYEGSDMGVFEADGLEDDNGSSVLTKRMKNETESADGQFSCDQCDKTFAKHSSLARHKYEHSGQRPHKCDICTKAFKHKHHLTEHKRLHSGEKPFQCSKCLKRFSHSGSFSQHMNHRYSYCKPYRE